MGNSFLAIEGIWVEGDIQMVIVNIYAPCETVEKRSLWEKILDTKKK